MQKVIVALISILLLISVNLYAQDGDLIESGDARGGTNIQRPAGDENHEGTEDNFGTNTAASNPDKDDPAIDSKDKTDLKETDKDVKDTDEARDKESTKDDAAARISALSATGGAGAAGPISEWALKPVQVTQAGNSGAAVTSIPIEVPPGRKGLEPNLSLNYTSNTGNGWLGVGWSLDMGAIQRSTKRGINYSANNYVVSANGSAFELAARGDWGTDYYGAKIEGAFSKYYYNTATGGWEVTAKDGTKYYYGTMSDGSSRQDSYDPNTGQYRVFKWCLDKVQDTNGNYMTITYWKDSANGEIYLDRIDYTGNTAGLSPTNYVQFIRDDGVRADAPVMYTTGSPIKTAYRLKTIEVYGNGQLARKYELEYDADQSLPGLQYSESTGRSLLGKITQYGSDGVTALPPQTFSWQKRTGNGFDDTSAWSGLTYLGIYPWRQVFADVNGDGRADWIHISEANGGIVHLADGNGGFNSAASWSGFGGYGNDPYYQRVADVNGDGMVDWIYLGAGGGIVHLADGNGGFNSVAAWQGLKYLGYEPYRHTFADVNGDGMADWIHISGAGGGIVHLATGSGKFNGTKAWSGLSYLGSDPSRQIFVDVNGDGLVDWIHISGAGGGIVHLADGNGGFNSSATWQGLGYLGSDPSRQKFADINGDGRADWIHISGSGGGIVHLADGNGGFSLSPSWQGLVYLGVYPDKQVFADVDGDGLTDWIHISGSGGGIVHLASGIYPDLLSTVENGMGGATTITYQPSSIYDNRTLPFIVQTVSSITIDDGNGVSSTTNYSYADGFYHFGEREFRGFRYVKATELYNYNPGSGSCIDYPDYDCSITETRFMQGNIYKVLPYEQLTKDSAGNTYTRTYNTYDYATPYTGVTFPRLIQRDDYEYDGTGTARQTTTTFTYDSYGNVKRKYSYGDISVTGDEKDEYISYSYDTSKWIVSLPSTTYINNSSAVKKAQTWFTYDGRGNLLTKKDWLSGGTNPVITYTNDPYGNVATIKDARGFITTISYDSTYTYPATITNPRGHIIQKTYDYRYGKVLTDTDPNGNITTYDYDEFGRLKKVTPPSPYGTTEYLYQNYGDPLSQNIRVEAKDSAGSLVQFKETYFDGLGRATLEKQGGPGARTIIVNTEYDNQGLVFRKSNPYFDGDPVYKTTYIYDTIDRLIQTDYPDGTFTTTGYMKGIITYIDANGHQKVVEKDICDRIITIQEYTGNSPSNYSLYATTTYQYDVLGNLTKVIDAQGNQTTIAYDTLSRKTSMTDPDMGYWTYTYDANGNLISQKDAKNQTINFQYDSLNRLRKKDYPAGTDMIYTYDEAFSTNPIGRLTTITDTSGTTKFYYDTMGQITASDKIIASDGSTYTTLTQYDALGRVQKITYPDNSEVDYTYDGNGRIKDIKSAAQTYVTYNSYTALGNPQLITYGNGAATQYQYYTNNNRLYSITTNSPTAGLMNLSYSYDNLGNITNITDLKDSAKTRDYTYDELNRLTSATSTSYGGTLTYQYDNIGNMTYNSRYGNYYYEDAAHKHAVTRIEQNGQTIDTYQYDPNGNMISGAGRTLTYDYDNRPTSIIYNGNAVVSVYDASGNRTQKMITAPSQNITTYIGQLYECTDGVCTKYIFAGTQRIAQIKGADTYYYHTDHLGSSNVITDTTGNKVEDIYYYPYGEIHTDTGSLNARHKFTGHEWDAETGLIYMGARYYDPKLARFISADTIVPMPFYPQTLNRYAYCYNNPIMIRDLDGHYGDFWGSVGSFFRGIGRAFASIGRSIWRGISAIGRGISHIARSAHNFVKDHIVKPVHQAMNRAFGGRTVASGGGSPGNIMYAANDNGTVTDAGGGSDRYNIQDCYRPMEGDKGTVFQYHRFIWINEENTGYGLTTRDDSSHYSFPGKIKKENTNDGVWGYHCKDLAISGDQMNRLRQEIKKDSQNPPAYHLKEYNCHKWVSDIFERSGIQR